MNVGLAKRSDIAATPSTAPRDIYSVLTAPAPSPVTIKRRGLAAKPRRATGIREQACQERGRGAGHRHDAGGAGGRRTAEAARLCPSPRRARATRRIKRASATGKSALNFPVSGGPRIGAMPRLILTFELFLDPSNTRRPHAQFTRTMTEPHHALTVDGEDSGGNEVHEIYVRLEAGARTTTIARSKTRTGMLRRGGSDLGCPITKMLQ